MKVSFYMKSFLCCAIGFALPFLQAADGLVPYHLSIYNTNFDGMTSWQLQEREKKIETDIERRKKSWREEDAWRERVHCLGANCCFWVPALAISALEFSAEPRSPQAGFAGFFIGAYAARSFSAWYAPHQPNRERELRAIRVALRKKKLKQD